jgi:peptidyl-tRNA hydrolase
MDLADYVLAEMAADERRELESRFDPAVDAMLKWMQDGIDAAMNAFNGPG